MAKTKVNNILEINIPLNERLNNEPLRVLTEEQFQFWKENGYVVVPNVVPQENIERTKKLIWEFEEKNPNDPSTWYSKPAREHVMPELRGAGMVELYNHQYFWDNRMHQKVYDAFVDIWGTKKLWCSIDRCNMSFPSKPGVFEFEGFIHWDADTSLQPRPENVQGILFLTDTQVGSGGLSVIPELYRDFEEWVKTQPEDRDPYHPDYTGYTPTPVTLKAGDLLIFHVMQAHGLRKNTLDTPNIHQYISMFPAQEENEELRDWRITQWRDREIPEGIAFLGDPRNWEKEKYERAQLTELGEKLLGLKKW
ncbi:phytanoyl-CoA dioxygenase [Bacillus timonensis]|uniref:Phytanoyl-CoA dioxygenase n=1 Tax=Bacillus timonensis TaxID=1033734 RepID=A0A4S3PWR2_9BACI|nr:phytanoyl-CoA dioxygenase family protein [Bacillus timonensis]THE13462.1 phytanoyl-CoA dioxygenase [Bacillus timonensis]